MYVGMKTMQSNDMSAPRETLAAGEITITATVTVNFILE